MLKDTFGRNHDYLRISLTDKCNLRCSYCMPTEEIDFLANKKLMSTDEIFEIAKTFVSLGIKKIRLTGGEPLLRKDFDTIFSRLASLPVSLHITTNGVLLHKHLDHMIAHGLKNINISLDSLQKDKFKSITKRNDFDKVIENIKLAQKSGLKIKINVVLIKDFNRDEILPFIELTKEENISIRFIEFMPFSGNKWDFNKTILLEDILDIVSKEKEVITHKLEANHIAKTYSVNGYKGDFGVISTISSAFCSGCNRVRLTADGKLKNCLFSSGETDLLTAIRKGESIKELIIKNVLQKKKSRGGMDTLEDIKTEGSQHPNRSMLTIGG